MLCLYDYFRSVLAFCADCQSFAPISPRETTDDSPHLQVWVAIKIDPGVLLGTARHISHPERGTPLPPQSKEPAVELRRPGKRRVPRRALDAKPAGLMYVTPVSRS